LADDVAVLERLARVPVIAHRVTQPDVEEFVTLIGQLPDSVAAVFVTRTDPVRARVVQRRVGQAGGPPVLSDEDTSAIALTAATLAYLRRIGRDPLGARILVADASSMPNLTPLLIVTGFPDITMWNSADAPRFPLSRAARDADAVLDPLPHATDAAGLAIDRPEGSVISCNGLDDRFLAAPGLLRALVEHPPGTFALDVGLYQICASAVAAATPRRYRPTDRLHDRGIADAIAAALHRAAAQAETGDGESHRSWRPRRR
jgi:malate dehydrogenase (oxaloacetate-decarboxylating)